MTMHVEWQDENGNTLEWYSGPISSALLEHAPRSSSCLRFIDPHGNTTFNQRQIGVLADELAQLATTTSNDELKTEIRALLAFVNRTIGETRTYLKFVGD